jgi:ornithine carbamoyltransferase
MAFNLKNRSFLKEIDFEPRELGYLLKLSEALKLAKYAGTEVKHLEGKEIALIFEKTSTRTRSAFEVGAYDQGAHVTYLDPSGSQLGHKESVADTAAVLGRMYDAIEFRGNSQADVEELAAHAGVPRQQPGRRRRTRRARRGAGLQRADQRMAPHPDARRLPDHARIQ